MAANVVPVGVGYEDGRQFGKSRRIRPQRFVGCLGGVRPSPGVNANQLPPIVGNHEVVFRELEPCERVHAPRHNLGDAPRRESMPGHNILRKRSDQGNRATKLLITASPQVVFRRGPCSPSERELSKVVVNFPQPARVRRLVDVLQAPDELILRGLPLMEETGQLRVDDAGNPVHNEDLPSGKLLGLFEYRNGFFHVTHSIEQRDRRRMLRSQQTDGAQIQGLLRAAKTGAEFLQPRRKKLHPLILQVGVRILGHQEKQQLRILRGSHPVDSFEILEFRTAGAGRGGLPGSRASGGRPQAGNQESQQDERSR